MSCEDYENVTPGQILRKAESGRLDTSNIMGFIEWLSSVTKTNFSSYFDLWNFSVEQLERFWALWWIYNDQQFASTQLGRAALSSDSFDPKLVLADRKIQGASWFSGATLNYTARALIGASDQIALVALSETKRETFTYRELFLKVTALATKLSDLGVKKGDGVVGYVTNGPASVIGFLASAAIGAVWSSCSLDFSTEAVVNRFKQLRPKVLICSTSYQYAGKRISRIAELETLELELESLIMVLVDDDTDPTLVSRRVPRVLFDSWSTANNDYEPFIFEEVDFMDPLWVLFSSGTTGTPKAIVQSHGGIYLEHLKVLSLHLDLRPRDVFFWYTTTGWMMWNLLVSGLLIQATIVLVDGSPVFPDPLRLFEVVESENVTYFGTSAPFVNQVIKSGTAPGDKFKFQHLKAIGSTGAPLSQEGFSWLVNCVSSDIYVESVSGGTDLCTAFLLSSPFNDTLAGYLNVPALGADIKVYDNYGNPVTGTLGELVICQPMPSMPVHFLNDPDNKRLHEAYFSYYPDVWRHGDWITFEPDKGYVIYGRSDATLNRSGIRMGTAEFYQVVESIDGVLDSLVIDTSYAGSDGILILFVTLSHGRVLDDELINTIQNAISLRLSRRYLPNQIIQVKEIPRTLNGKKTEVPVRRIFLGQDRTRVVSTDSLVNPSSIDEFCEIFRAWSTKVST